MLDSSLSTWRPIEGSEEDTDQTKRRKTDEPDEKPRLLCRRDVLAAAAESVGQFPAFVYRGYDTVGLVFCFSLLMHASLGLPRGGD